MAGVLLKIKEKIDSLNPSERIVAEYILENPQESIGLSVAQLAQNSKGSQAAIIRLCKSLDYNGYPDFTISLARDMAIKSKREKNLYMDIQVGDDIETIAKNVCLNNVKAIDDSFAIIDYGEIKKAVELLTRVNRIDLYGYGASAIVTMDAHQKFLRINKHVTSYYDPHLQITSASNLGKGSAAIAVSWSGKTKETIDAAIAAKESGATIISITKFGDNNLVDISDIKLQLLSPETTIRSGAMSSRIAQLNMIDIIYSSVVSGDYDNLSYYLETTRKRVSGRKYQEE